MAAIAIINGFPTTLPPPPDVDRGSWILPLNWTIRSLAVFVVLARLFTRGVLKRALGWDDVAIAMAAALAIAEGATETVRIHYGLGRHSIYLPPSAQDINARLLVPVQLCNFISLFFTRTSIGLFILRLLARSQTWPRRLTHLAMALNFACTLATCVVFGLQCPLVGPDPHALKAACTAPAQLRVALYVVGSFNVAIDFANVGLPVFVIRSVQMSSRLKASATLIVSLGLLTCGCGIGKILSTRGIRDQAWDGVDVTVFGAFEESSAIIFASLPAVHQLYRYLRERCGARSSRAYAVVGGGSGSGASERSGMPKAEKALGGGREWPSDRKRPARTTEEELEMEDALELTAHEPASHV